jgi:hypothetical protein
MAQVGRISGGLLQDNLVRQGINLNFANTDADVSAGNPLLHLDVNNSKIGINNNAPSDVLSVPTTYQTTNLLATYSNIADFAIDTSSITNLAGNINLTSSSNIFATAIATDDLKLDFNRISSTTTNTNIELRPNGDGALNIRSDWNISGNLHSTGNITFGGDLVLGDSDQDNVTFDADVNSSLIPDQNSVSSLGSSTKQWRNLYSNLLNGQRIELDTILIDDASLALRQGNTYYVSTLGSDTNVGDHQHGAFRTLKHALEVMDGSTAGPTVIHIFPGEYEEEFPLTVPSYVTIHGEDIRNTIIKPTVATQTNSAFYVEGDVTVENITIKDFYNGYAFSFTPGGLVSTRSPYIRNVTVITKGSVTSAADPRGFAQGDAGQGAYIDGAVLDSESLEASMLFHGCTFITPGVDCITMTNGVRVEWLNSFTYFANRGLYATQGVTGKVMPDLSVRYGAEIRVIGSANVYGNYGAVADGADTLMYLIGHNFAYIGAGFNISNDNTLSIESQQVVELNSGKIYYTSTNEDGNFKVGNAFYVDFESGTTSIDASLVDFSGVSNINIRNGNDVTYIDGSRIDIGNIRISGNTVDTIDGPLILSPVTELFNTDTNPGLIVSKGTTAQQPNLTSGIRYNTQVNIYEGYSTGGLSFGGIYSTDKQTSVKAHPTNNTLIFTANNIQTAEVHHYGLRVNGLSNNDLFFNNNSIVTTLSNSDIELRRSGESVLNMFDLNILESTITNTSSNSLTVAMSGRGYAKFDSTTGLVIPYGTTAERPAFPEAGDTRWNTDLEVLEVYSGVVWQRAAGEGESVTEEVLRELTDIWTLVLG